MTNVALILTLFIVGCSTKSASQSERHTKLPTATEVFNLRTKCAELARKFDEDMFHGIAVTQDVLSNYSIKENRCYVTLDDSDGGIINHHNLRSLNDGQTRELLAVSEYYSQTQPDGRGSHGSIWVETNIDTTVDCHPGGDCGLKKATAFIDERMRRDQ
jgi:hypothetical protein